MAYPLIYNREQWWAYLYIDWFVVIVQQQVPLVNMKKQWLHLLIIFMFISTFNNTL